MLTLLATGLMLLPVPSLTQLLTESPYQAYTYAYPHKTAYRPLAPPVPLADLWSGERREALMGALPAQMVTPAIITADAAEAEEASRSSSRSRWAIRVTQRTAWRSGALQRWSYQPGKRTPAPQPLR